MSLIRQFDKKYSFAGLLGFENEDDPRGKKREKPTIQTNSNPMAFIKNNHIDYHNSIHTSQRQRSEYVKIDDNLLNFDFDKCLGVGMNSDLKPLSDSEIEERKEDLNRMQVKFISSKQVEDRKFKEMGQKQQFMVKIQNLKHKGDTL